MRSNEILKRVLAFLYIVGAMFCDYLLVREYRYVYGQTVKFFVLIGMSIAVAYVILIHLYRELVSCRKAQVTGIYAVGSCVFSLVCLYFVKSRYLFEDVCFFVVIFTFILLLECTRLSTPIDDIQCIMCKVTGKKKKGGVNNLNEFFKMSESSVNDEKLSSGNENKKEEKVEELVKEEPITGQIEKASKEGSAEITEELDEDADNK